MEVVVMVMVEVVLVRVAVMTVEMPDSRYRNRSFKCLDITKNPRGKILLKFLGHGNDGYGGGGGWYGSGDGSSSGWVNCDCCW